MEITGRKNLELTKRALLSHLVYCSHFALRSPDKVSTEKWDPEIKEVNALLDAVEINLSREPVNEGEQQRHQITYGVENSKISSGR